VHLECKSEEKKTRRTEKKPNLPHSVLCPYYLATTITFKKEEPVHLLSASIKSLIEANPL